VAQAPPLRHTRTDCAFVATACRADFGPVSGNQLAQPVCQALVKLRFEVF